MASQKQVPMMSWSFYGGSTSIGSAGGRGKAKYGDAHNAGLHSPCWVALLSPLPHSLNCYCCMCLSRHPPCHQTHTTNDRMKCDLGSLVPWGRTNCKTTKHSLQSLVFVCHYNQPSPLSSSSSPSARGRQVDVDASSLLRKGCSLMAGEA